MLTTYNVISSDGFIAQVDGNEDFIPDEVWDDFLELCQNYDTLLLGKNTFDTIQSFDKKLIDPFENLPIKKVIVTREHDFLPKTGYETASSLEDALAKGSNVLLCSGPTLNTAFLEGKFIDHIILNKLPIVLGSGISQFSERALLQITPLPELTQHTSGRRMLDFYQVHYKK